MLLAACGGGGSSSSTAAASTSTSTPAAPLSNFVSVIVDSGPPSLQTGADPYVEANTPYVTITLCAPGTTNCQTIDHVAVDTGSIGLRVPASVLSASLLSALTLETDPTGNPVGECYQYVDGYLFGSVRQADFTIGGEKVAGMPLQVAGDSGAFTAVPSSCSSGGGANLATVSALGANAIIGIGTTTTDCGANCTVSGGQGAAFYYDCPASGCSSIIARSASASAPFQQLPNPVAAMAVDNNGAILSLPAASAPAASLSGTLYFGIGTQTNNALGSASVITATTSASRNGPGLITVVYKGQSLPDSFIDSGSSLYFFTDSTIPLCTASDATGYYCPPSTLTLSLTLQGQSAGAGTAVSLALQNAEPLLNTGDAVLPAIGGNPSALNFSNPYPTSFDLGLPFFFGRNVYTAIEGRQAGSTVGPYYAF
jgi:hypothetical protein